MWTTPSMISSYRTCFCSWCKRYSFLSTRWVYSSFSLLISASFSSFSSFSFSAFEMIWLMCSSCSDSDQRDEDQYKIKGPTRAVQHWVKSALYYTLRNISKPRPDSFNPSTFSCNTLMRSCRISKTLNNTHSGHKVSEQVLWYLWCTRGPNNINI